MDFLNTFIGTIRTAHTGMIVPAVRILFLTAMTVCAAGMTRAQFSPGELSRAHQQLEGPNNCTQCHEVGKSISGQKCLACHTEIQQMITGNHGYHFRVVKQQCIDCHKDHVGRNAATYRFDPKSFNHTETGYSLAGKHRELECVKCHNNNQIRDRDVQKLITDHPHSTYLGLRSACISCHANPHEETQREKCAFCHTETTWKKPRPFDHSGTKYQLLGKHRTVECAKCHTALRADSTHGIKTFLIADYAECNTCHKSPHSEKISKQTCRSCHTEDGWNVATKKTFNHDLTGYRLAGKHAAITCEKCHRREAGATFSSTFLLKHRGCNDCHQDYHQGDFTKGYENNCSDCHTLERFSPSIYTLAMHNKSRFRLTGGHLAIPCQMCHPKKGQKPAPFHFSDMRCESCHKSVHDIKFDARRDTSACLGCHQTEAWKSVTFDHGTTKFALTGKHASTVCRDCHKPTMDRNGRLFPFKGLQQACESCHKDTHNKQFEANGATACEKCHTPDIWKNLLFDHQRDSKFKTSGAHAKVACNLCHKQESAGGVTFVRYKPLSAECETCHTKGKGT
jgi:hypothetical protein